MHQLPMVFRRKLGPIFSINFARLGLLEPFYFSWFKNMRTAQDDCSSRLATTRTRCSDGLSTRPGSREVEVRFGYSDHIHSVRSKDIFGMLKLDTRHDLRKLMDSV